MQVGELSPPPGRSAGLTCVRGAFVDLRTELATLARGLARLNYKTRKLGIDLAKVNAKTQRASAEAGPLSIGFTDVPITWPTPWPDIQYHVTITLEAGDNALTNTDAVLKPDAQTAGCVVRIRSLVLLGATIGVHCLAVRT